MSSRDTAVEHSRGKWSNTKGVGKDGKDESNIQYEYGENTGYF